MSELREALEAAAGAWTATVDTLVKVELVAERDPDRGVVGFFKRWCLRCANWALMGWAVLDAVGNRSLQGPMALRAQEEEVCDDPLERCEPEDVERHDVKWETTGVWAPSPSEGPQEDMGEQPPQTLTPEDMLWRESRGYGLPQGTMCLRIDPNTGTVPVIPGPLLPLTVWARLRSPDGAPLQAQLAFWFDWALQRSLDVVHPSPGLFTMLWEDDDGRHAAVYVAWMAPMVPPGTPDGLWAVLHDRGDGPVRPSQVEAWVTDALTLRSLPAGSRHALELRANFARTAPFRRFVDALNELWSPS